MLFLNCSNQQLEVIQSHHFDGPQKAHAILLQKGYITNHVTVAGLLKEMDYSLQANKKTREGSKNPDRNTQFEHINNKDPVVSIDTKKKELIGNFKNSGRKYAFIFRRRT